MSKRLQRNLELGLLAKDLVTLKCRTQDPSRQKVRVQRIVDRLGLLHGLPQKIGQLLAFSELNESAPAFSRLTESHDTSPASEAFAEIEYQLGRPLSACFREVNPQGISASIGQVHQGVLLDGREVAIKLQHPGIADSIQWDLQALGWLTAPIGDLRRGFDLPSYRIEVGSMLQRELDYTVEAESIDAFRRHTSDWPSLEVPTVIRELSGPRLLVTSWVRGEPLRATSAWTAADRQVFATTILRVFLHGLFRWGLLHSDPHPGNYRFQPASTQHPARVGLIDFGCVKQVNPRIAEPLARLILTAMEHRLEDEAVWDCFVQMGFAPTLLAQVRPQLRAVAEVLCQPFSQASAFQASQWSLGDRLASLLGDKRQIFRTAGPADLLFILRTFQGVLHYLTHLGVPIGWRELFLEAHPPPPSSAAAEVTPRPSAPTRSMKSDALHIQVREAAQTKISLTFDAKATDHLEELVPLELRDSLRHRSVDLAAIVERARRSDYEPGNLFSWEEGSKSVRVWLA